MGRFSHHVHSPRCRPVCVQVVANKLVVMESGEWVLPYWREQPRNERIAGFTDFKSSCHVPAPPTVDAEEDKDTEAAAAMSHTATGVLVSADAGHSWRARGNLTDPRTVLIEGTVAVLESQKLLMLLRTQTGCTFHSTSTVRVYRQHCNRTSALVRALRRSILGTRFGSADRECVASDTVAIGCASHTCRTWGARGARRSLWRSPTPTARCT